MFKEKTWLFLYIYLECLIDKNIFVEKNKLVHKTFFCRDTITIYKSLSNYEHSHSQYSKQSKFIIINTVMQVNYKRYCTF